MADRMLVQGAGQVARAGAAGKLAAGVALTEAADFISEGTNKVIQARNRNFNSAMKAELAKTGDLTDEEYKDYRPLNFLFYKIFEWAIYSKYEIYDFGTFTLNQEPNMGLGRYKENFGASGVFRDLIEMRLSQ